jgi:4-hydroxybenzoate polyprenyltransferase
VEEYLVGGVDPSAITWLDPPEIQLQVRKLTTYLSFVRFSHSVFALPFALTGCAARVAAIIRSRGRQVAWIVVCMVSARSAAMGFNRSGRCGS